VCPRASPPFNIYLSRYTRGTRCSITFWFYSASVSDPSLVNTTCSGMPRYFHGGNTGSNPVGDANILRDYSLCTFLMFGLVALESRLRDRDSCCWSRPADI